MKITKKQKTKLLEQSSIAAARILIYIMNLLDIPNFITCTIIDDKDGTEYELKFERVKILNEDKNASPKEGE